MDIPKVYFGPPGAGKTNTCLNIVAEELKRGVPPDRICYLAFTKAAAGEAARRAMARFNVVDEKQFLYFRTIHSLCYQLMGVSKARVMEPEITKDFAKYANITVSDQRLAIDEGAGTEEGDRILFLENLSRLNCITLREQFQRDDDELPWREVERVANALKEYKKANDLTDFTDMLSDYLQKGQVPKLEVLIIDEAQDLSPLQWKVIRKLMTYVERVYVAGDDDQAIYKWAGADVDQFINFVGEHFVLQQSYRVPRVIMPLALGISGAIKNRKEKVWLPKDEEGLLTFYRPPIIDENVDTLVLSRNKKFIDRFGWDLQNRGILYAHRFGWSISKDILEAVQTWTDLTRNKFISFADLKNLYQYLGLHTRIQYGYKTLMHVNKELPINMEVLKTQGGLLLDDNVPWFDALDKIHPRTIHYLQAILRHTGGKIPTSTNIRLSTIHSIKGGEADRVLLMPDIANRTMRQTRKYPDEERRVWYVGVTRARHELHILQPYTDQYIKLQNYLPKK